MKKKIRLGVNIDHVATQRNARNENFPDLLRVANILRDCNVDLITVHLREDRRHINDKDVEELKNTNYLPLNLEMAATDEMKNICFKPILRLAVLFLKDEKNSQLKEDWM